MDALCEDMKRTEARARGNEVSRITLGFNDPVTLVTDIFPIGGV